MKDGVFRQVSRRDVGNADVPDVHHTGRLDVRPRRTPQDRLHLVNIAANIISLRLDVLVRRQVRRWHARRSRQRVFVVVLVAAVTGLRAVLIRPSRIGNIARYTTTGDAAPTGTVALGLMAASSAGRPASSWRRPCSGSITHSLL